MNKNKFLLLLTLFTIISIMLAACASPAPTPVAPVMPKIDPKAILSQARTYYNGGVQRDTNITNLQRKFENTMNTFRLGATDLIANNKNCFKDGAEAEKTVAQAVMGTQPREAVFNALVTASVSGEQFTMKCAEGNQKIADFIISKRPEVQNAAQAVFEAATEYMQYTSAFPEIQWMNDFMQTYGDTAVLYQKLADNGIGVSDWTWLPTKNLWVSHTDQKLCQYYISGQFMENVPYSTKLKFTGHTDALARLYESAWNPVANGGRGECRMYRYAALEYMTRSILSSDTQNVIQGGQDQSLFPTPTK